MDEKEFADEIWYWYLTDKWRVPPPPEIVRAMELKRRIFALLPSNPHCLECGMPMAGLGGFLLQGLGIAARPRLENYVHKRTAPLVLGLHPDGRIRPIEGGQRRGGARK